MPEGYESRSLDGILVLTIGVDHEIQVGLDIDEVVGARVLAAEVTGQTIRIGDSLGDAAQIEKAGNAVTLVTDSDGKVVGLEASIAAADTSSMYPGTYSGQAFLDHTNGNRYVTHPFAVKMERAIAAPVP